MGKSGVLRVIRKIADGHRDKHALDRELLTRFAENRDEDAFATLVTRHGSMVMGLGLRVLRHHQDAEDVCQATFLLLAKKANTTAWRDSVANWLYEVAYHLSLKARDASTRRNTHEGKVQPKTPPDVLAEISVRDLQTILDEELSRVAKKYRTPLILCCLEGKTRDEAARFLGVPLSTVISRLVECREVLRRRLARRGVPLSLALAGTTLFSETVRAAVPATLVRATSQVALQVIAGETITNLVSANVSALVKGGMKTMFVIKLKVAMAVLLAGLLVSSLMIAGLDTPPASALAQQPTGQKKDKPPASDPAAKSVSRLKVRATLAGHHDEVNAVAFSPDGKLLASASKDSTIKIWDTSTGKEVQTLATHQAPVASVAFSPDGKSLASVSRDSIGKAMSNTPDAVLIWDVATWEAKVKLKDNKGSFRSVVFSPDSKVMAATAARGRLVKLWDTGTGKNLATLEEDPDIEQIIAGAFSPDGKTLVLGAGFAFGKSGDPIRLWNWAENKPIGSLIVKFGAQFDSFCFQLAFTRDGKTLLTHNGVLTLWDFEKSQPMPWKKSSSRAFALSADEKVVALLGPRVTKKGEFELWQGKVELWDMAKGEKLEVIPMDTFGNCAAFSGKGGMLAVGCQGKAKRGVDNKTGRFDVDDAKGVVRIWDVRDPVIQPKK